MEDGKKEINGNIQKRSNFVTPAILERPIAVFRLVVIATLAYLFTKTVWSFFGRISGILMLLLLALFVSFAFERPLLFLVSKGWKRGLAAGLLVLFTVVLLLLVAGATGALVLAQAQKMLNDYDTYVQAVVDIFSRLGVEISPETINRLSSTIQDSLLPSALGVSGKAGVALASFGFVMFVSFYMLAQGPALRSFVSSLFPEKQQKHILQTWEQAVVSTGGYLLSRFVQGVFGILVGAVFFTILDIPYALALAVWLGVISQLIPVLGTYIGAGLPILVAFVDEPSSALWVVLVIVIWRQVENYYLRPKLSKKYLALNPGVGVVAVACGALLAGFVGIVLALPIAATVHALITEYYNKASREQEAEATSSGNV